MESVDSRNGSHLEMTCCSHGELHLGAVRSNMKAVHLAVLLQSSELLPSVGGHDRRKTNLRLYTSVAVQLISKQHLEINFR